MSRNDDSRAKTIHRPTPTWVCLLSTLVSEKATGGSQSLLEAGASPHYHEEVYRAKLFVEGASSYVNNPSEDAEDVLVSLLKNGADISDLSVFENTETLLNLLIMNSHKELVKQIILVGTNLTKTGSSKVNLVFFVVTRVDLERTEKLEIVEMLLQSGADPNLPSFSPNFTALSWASFLGDTHLVNLLLSWGAQTLPPLPFYSPLFMAMSNGRGKENAQVSKILVKHPFDPNFVEPHQEGSVCRTSLAQAIFLGDSSIVRELLVAGADPFIAGCSNAALCSLGEAMTIQLYNEEDAYKIVQAILAYDLKDINTQLDCYSSKIGFHVDLLDTLIMSNYTKTIGALLDSGI